MSEIDKDDLRVLTPPFRISFPNVFKPRAAFDNQEPNYNIQMLFPKDPSGYPNEILKKMGAEGLKPLKKAMALACKKKWGERENWPKFKHPAIRDGEEKSDLAQYENMWFINARSKFKPGIVNQHGEDIISPEEFYAGAWGRATLNVYTYENKFGAGVQFGLQNLQFLCDGEALAGKKNAKDDFDIIEGFDDDAFGGETEMEEDFGF